MAKLTESSNEVVNARAAADIALAANGYFRLYAGPKPGSADAGLSGNTLLHECRLGSPAAGAPVNGAFTFNPLSTASTLADGTASFARIYKSNGSSCLFQLTVGTAADGANVTLPSLTIAAGVSWPAGAFSMTNPNSVAGF